jgi:hypothetical protein
VSKGVHIAGQARASCSGVVHRVCSYYPGKG